MFGVSAQLRANCSKTPERMDWLGRLPSIVQELEKQWSLTLGEPLGGDEVSASWVCGATLSDGSPAVLKVGMPHMEGEHEIHGLRFWNGEPTVRLLKADQDAGAMLLE